MNAAAADEPGIAIVSVGPPLFASVVLRSRFVTESLLVDPDVVPKPHDVPFERLYPASVTLPEQLPPLVWSATMEPAKVVVPLLYIPPPLLLLFPLMVESVTVMVPPLL